MKNRRAKIAAGATVLGLGALGGVALETNHGIPAAAQRLAVAGRSAPVITTASGAIVSQPAAVRAGASPRPPIVTRASGAGTRFDD